MPTITIHMNGLCLNFANTPYFALIISELGQYGHRVLAKGWQSDPDWMREYQRRINA